MNNVFVILGNKLKKNSKISNILKAYFPHVQI